VYQNGQRLNRHARKRRHIDNLKRRSTPYEFSSYESFVEYERYWDAFRDGMFAAMYGDYYPRRTPTGRPWYERYWEAYTGYVSPGWKKNLKTQAHRDERRYWREHLGDVMKMEDIEDEETPHERRGRRHSDPWHWD